MEKMDIWFYYVFGKDMFLLVDMCMVVFLYKKRLGFSYLF